MNIKVNKKLLSLLIAGGIALTPCSVAYGAEINTDEMSFDKVIESVEKKSVIDEALDVIDVYTVNPYTYRGKLQDLDDASAYLGDILEIKEKLTEMGVPTLSENDKYYYMVDEAATWSPEDVHEFINDYYYDQDMKRVAFVRLSYYNTYLNKELRENGLEVSSLLLEASIKARLLDKYDNNCYNISHIKIDGTNFVYDNKIIADETDSISLLNIVNKAKKDDTISDKEVYTLVNDSFNASKNIIYNGVKVKNNKVKVK